MTEPDAVQGWSPVSTHLPIGAVGNLRDLGGTPTLDGRVVADYALTGILRPNRVEVYSRLFVDSGVDSAGIAVLFDTPGPAMGDALAGLEAEFGSVIDYLRQACGLEQAELDALRVNLLSATGQAVPRVRS